MGITFGKKHGSEYNTNTTLAREYIQLTERLNEIRTNFDFVTDEAAVDALIYEENAVLAKLSALYKEAKASGSRLEIYELKK